MMENLKLRDVMTREVEVISPDAMLDEAAEKMRSLDVGPLPVVDGNRVVGMLTDRDITVRATAEGLDPKRTKVEQVMTADVVYCYDDESVGEAARKMKDKQIRRLLVLGRDQRIVGVVSLGDLAIEGARESAEDALEGISQPGRTPQR